MLADIMGMQDCVTTHGLSCARSMENAPRTHPPRRGAERSAERQYRILFERSLAGVYCTSLGGRILDCNEAFAHIFGFANRSQALRMKAHDLYPSAAAREAAVARLRARGALANSEDCLQRRDGTPVWVLANEMLLPVAPDEEPVILGTLIDITQRKLVEESLRQERDFNSAVVDTAGLLVLVCDRRGRVVRVSRGVTAATGFTEAAACGQFYWDVFPPEGRREALRQWFAALDRSAQALRVEAWCRAQGGGERRIAWSIGFLRDATGEIEFVIATGIDVTDQRRLEGQLRQAQKMDAIGQLAGGIAHDFNNLLTVITGHCDILLDASPQDARPPAERVAKIKAAADRAVALTRQLLAFSRAQVLTPQVLDLNAVVGAAHELLRPLLGEQIELRAVLDPTAGRVSADRVQVEQVIMNLAINARDAMPEGGVVTLETANAEVDELYRRARPMVPAGRYVLLAVSDTGQGMDAATRRRIFEPFFTTKPHGRGTGLGLATVYGIVKQSNGFIWVYTEPGRGTSFKVYLPRVDAVEAPPAAAPRPGRGETVLVVDDDAALRGLARDLLVRQGYRVLESAGAQAAALAREQKLDLLLTDLILPGACGAELAQQLRRIQPGLRVLYASGYTRAALEARGQLPADAAFVAKPFTADVLANALRTVLDAAPAVAGALARAATQP